MEIIYKVMKSINNKIGRVRAWPMILHQLDLFK